jgi:hypothetical protein
VLRKHQTKIANTGPWQPPLRFLRYLCCRLLPRCHDLESILKIPNPNAGFRCSPRCTVQVDRHGVSTLQSSAHSTSVCALTTHVLTTSLLADDLQRDRRNAGHCAKPGPAQGRGLWGTAAPCLTPAACCLLPRELPHKHNPVQHIKNVSNWFCFPPLSGMVLRAAGAAPAVLPASAGRAAEAGDPVF